MTGGGGVQGGGVVGGVWRNCTAVANSSSQGPKASFAKPGLCLNEGLLPGLNVNFRLWEILL